MSNNCVIPTEKIDTPTPCVNNMSGVQRLLFIPRADVESINIDTAATIAGYNDVVVIGSAALTGRAITVKSGKEFAEVYCSDQLGELVYTPQGQKGSRCFKAELEVHHPGFKKRLLGFLSDALNKEFILVVQVSNGDWHLLGNTRRGAKLAENTKATSGRAITDANGAECHFACDVKKPLVFYDGWSPEDSTVGVEKWRLAYILGTETGGYAIATEDNYIIEV